MIAGIDLGTQGVKVALFRKDFTVLARAFVPCPTRYPQPGWAEQDPAAWESALARAARDAAGQSGLRAGDLEAVGITGQLDGCVPVDADGRPLHPCLIWMDRRAPLSLRPSALRRVRKVAGVTPDPGHMAAKIRWLAGTLGSAAEVACYHQPVSYLVSLLTGQSVFDHALASTTMLYSLLGRDYDERLLAAFGIPRRVLPRIAGAHERAGALSDSGARLTGFPEGVPVAVGTGDDFAGPLGAGMTEPGSAACTAGTAEVVGALSSIPVVDPAGLVETHGYPAGHYFVENPGWLSGGAVDWCADLLGLGGAAEVMRLAEAVPPGSDGVTFIPALSGAMSPEWIPGARGCFYGLSPAHGSSHLARAVLEGCAFAMRDVIERLRSLSVPVGRILLMGGGANSRLMARIRADVSRLPVRRILEPDTASVGAAMCAAVAAGIHPDLRSCAPGRGGEGEDFPADPRGADLYDEAYRSYQRLFDSLRPMFGQREGA